MANFTGSTTVEAQPRALFEYLSDVGNLPRYFSRMVSARPGEGEEVHTTARMPDGQEVQADAWFRVDQAAQRIEWGSEGPNDYHGHLQVRPSGDGSEVEVHLHTTRVAPRNREVHDGIQETLTAIREQVGAGAGRPPSAGTAPTAAQQAARQAAQQAGRQAARTGQQAADTAETVRDAAASTAGTAGQVARSPLTATGQLLGDLAESARRPDAVLYWGGLAGAAVLGAIEWPVAVALGVGLAIARSRRASGG